MLLVNRLAGAGTGRATSATSSWARYDATATVHSNGPSSLSLTAQRQLPRRPYFNRLRMLVADNKNVIELPAALQARYQELEVKKDGMKFIVSLFYTWPFLVAPSCSDCLFAAELEVRQDGMESSCVSLCLACTPCKPVPSQAIEEGRSPASRPSWLTPAAPAAPPVCVCVRNVLTFPQTGPHGAEQADEGGGAAPAAAVGVVRGAASRAAGPGI